MLVCLNDELLTNPMKSMIGPLDKPNTKIS